MGEICLSASEFRVRLKDLANHVARGGEPVIVSRHGLETFVMVSLDDYQRWNRDKPRERDKLPEVHPEAMADDELDRVYAELKDSDDPAIERWCEKARLVFTARDWQRQVKSRGPPS